jgi:hypothetical protein
MEVRAMRANVRSSVPTKDQSLVPPPDVVSQDIEETKPVERRTGGWAEDWTEPSKHHQVSALWPLMWLTLPLALLVLYGLFSGHH